MFQCSYKRKLPFYGQIQSNKIKQTNDSFLLETRWENFYFHPHTSTDCNRMFLSMLDHGRGLKASILPILSKKIVSRNGHCLSCDEPFILEIILNYTVSLQNSFLDFNYLKFFVSGFVFGDMFSEI